MRIVNLVHIGLRALAWQLTDGFNTLTVPIRVMALLHPLRQVYILCGGSSSWCWAYRHLVDQVFEHHGRFAPAAVTWLLSIPLLIVFGVLAHPMAFLTLVDGVREQAALPHCQTYRLLADVAATRHVELLNEVLFGSLFIFWSRYSGNEVIEMLVSATTFCFFSRRR